MFESTNVLAILIEVVGWIGTTLILAAYVYVTRRGTSKTYHVLNLFGAAGIVINGAYHQALPAAFLNICWMLIAFYGMATVEKRRKMPAN